MFIEINLIIYLKFMIVLKIVLKKLRKKIKHKLFIYVRKMNIMFICKI